MHQIWFRKLKWSLVYSIDFLIYLEPFLFHINKDRSIFIGKWTGHIWLGQKVTGKYEKQGTGPEGKFDVISIFFNSLPNQDGIITKSEQPRTGPVWNLEHREAIIENAP